jgi:hypothetical protein
VSFLLHTPFAPPTTHGRPRPRPSCATDLPSCPDCVAAAWQPSVSLLVTRRVTGPRPAHVLVVIQAILAAAAPAAALLHANRAAATSCRGARQPSPPITYPADPVAPTFTFSLWFIYLLVTLRWSAPALPPSCALKHACTVPCASPGWHPEQPSCDFLYDDFCVHSCFDAGAASWCRQHCKA